MFPIHLDDKTNNYWQRVEYDCEKRHTWPTWNGGVAFPRKGRKLRSHQILRWDVIVAVGCTGVELREEINSGK